MGGGAYSYIGDFPSVDIGIAQNVRNWNYEKPKCSVYECSSMSLMKLIPSRYYIITFYATGGGQYRGKQRENTYVRLCLCACVCMYVSCNCR